MGSDASERAGWVEPTVDNDRAERQVSDDLKSYALVLLGQFILSLLLLLWAFRTRVLRPLAGLTAFSNQLADGEFEHAIAWHRRDEIGHLALQMDLKRHDLQAAFAQQRAILDNVQVGVVFECEQTIQLASRHAERVYGIERGRMNGLPADLHYPSDTHSVAARARALQTVATDRGRYDEEIELERVDGGVFWAHVRTCRLDRRDARAPGTPARCCSSTSTTSRPSTTPSVTTWTTAC